MPDVTVTCPACGTAFPVRPPPPDPDRPDPAIRPDPAAAFPRVLWPSCPRCRRRLRVEPDAGRPARGTG